MSLFVKEKFKAHSGQELDWKIDCDALGDEDIETLAFVIRSMVGPFSSVEGIPQGGLRLAAALSRHVVAGLGPHLIVDDVCTTGASLREARSKLPPDAPCKGAVLFARGQAPWWVKAVFVLGDLA